MSGVAEPRDGAVQCLPPPSPPLAHPPPVHLPPSLPLFCHPGGVGQRWMGPTRRVGQPPPFAPRREQWPPFSNCPGGGGAPAVALSGAADRRGQAVVPLGDHRALGGSGSWEGEGASVSREFPRKRIANQLGSTLRKTTEQNLKDFCAKLSRGGIKV